MFTLLLLITKYSRSKYATASQIDLKYNAFYSSNSYRLRQGSLGLVGAIVNKIEYAVI